jgi:DNA invertase Pin-like site-specific DNA recombinase
MADAAMHRFDAVLVWTLERWGRSVADCAESIQQLHNWGIRWDRVLATVVSHDLMEYAALTHQSNSAA